jgi:hypothetical protein
VRYRSELSGYCPGKGDSAFGVLLFEFLELFELFELLLDFVVEVFVLLLVEGLVLLLLLPVLLFCAVTEMERVRQMIRVVRRYSPFFIV